MKKKIYLYSLVIIVMGLALQAFSLHSLPKIFIHLEVEEKLKNTATLIRISISDELEKASKLIMISLPKNYSIYFEPCTTSPTKLSMITRYANYLY